MVSSSEERLFSSELLSGHQEEIVSGGQKMLAVTLTIGTLVSIMMFFVGGVVGWLAKDHVYQTQPVYTHPEMFDENGNLLPDEILAVRFENDEGAYLTNSTKKTTTRKPRATKPKAKAPAKRNTCKTS